MLKLSKTQAEIEVLAKRVPTLTKSQLEWASKDYTYFQWIKCTDTNVPCPNCKESVHFGQLKRKKGEQHIDHEMVCPHCGAKIRVNSYDTGYMEYKKRKRNHLQENFFQVMNVVGDWQVTRLIYMCRYTYIIKENTNWRFYEVCQAWNNPKTDKTYFRSLPKKIMCGWCYNPYSLYHWNYECSNPDYETYRVYPDTLNVLSPRRVNGSNFFSTKNIAPRPHIHKQYKRMGLTSDFLRRNIEYSAIGWFSNFGGKSYKPMWETMIKAKAYNVIKGMGLKFMDKEIYFSAWKIANRHGYKIADVSEWLDIVSLLKDMGMDYRNPKYICPSDEHAMHQSLLGVRDLKRKEKERREERERDLKRLQEAIVQYGEEYAKRIAKYLDIDISDETLHIVVLPDIQAFYDEADHLCHCVFRSRYYLHTDSLILSARDSKGKRWETIEVNLNDFSIAQSYGYGDEFTTKHKQILNLVESNMWQIKQRFARAS